MIVPDTVTLTPVPPPKSRNPREVPLGSLYIPPHLPLNYPANYLTRIIKGPLGELSLGVPPFLSIKEEPIPSSTSRRVSVSVQDPKIRQQREMWGTSRSNLQQMVLGVTEGHSAILRLVGVGYKAMVEKDGRMLSMKLGFSHTIDMKVPEGVKCTVPTPTRILLEGCHKTLVRQFAAFVREWRIPEPYKGKVWSICL